MIFKTHIWKFFVYLNRFFLCWTSTGIIFHLYFFSSSLFFARFVPYSTLMMLSSYALPKHCFQSQFFAYIGLFREAFFALHFIPGPVHNTQAPYLLILRKCYSFVDADQLGFRSLMSIEVIWLLSSLRDRKCNIDYERIQLFMIQKTSRVLLCWSPRCLKKNI